MKNFIKDDGSFGRLYSSKRSFDDAVVKDGLVVTPSEMARKVDLGIPVSVSTSDTFYDGDLNPTWDVPLERTRGVDPATLWNEQKNIRSKFVKAHKTDIQTYGE